MLDEQLDGERLADLMNRRWSLSRAEYVELYETLCRKVWRRSSKLHDHCSTLQILPNEAMHDCFTHKILYTKTNPEDAAQLTATNSVPYVLTILNFYLIERQRSFAALKEVTNTESDVGDPRGLDSRLNEGPLISGRYIEWLEQEAAPSLRAFIDGLSIDDLILLKCWYSADRRPALYKFKEVVENPDYAAKKLGIKLCNAQFLDYSKTTIGRWASELGQKLSREELLEIGILLEMLPQYALDDQRVDCPKFDPDPESSPSGSVGSEGEV